MSKSLCDFSQSFSPITPALLHTISSDPNVSFVLANIAACTQNHDNTQTMHIHLLIHGNFLVQQNNYTDRNWPVLCCLWHRTVVSVPSLSRTAAPVVCMYCPVSLSRLAHQSEWGEDYLVEPYSHVIRSTATIHGQHVTFAPWSSSSRVVTSPIPWAPPVTRATLPASDAIFVS